MTALNANIITFSSYAESPKLYNSYFIKRVCMCILFLLENVSSEQKELISWYFQFCLSFTEGREGWKGKETWTASHFLLFLFPTSLCSGKVAAIAYSNTNRCHRDMMGVAWSFRDLEYHCFWWGESSGLKTEYDLLEMSGSCAFNGRNAMFILLLFGASLILYCPLESCIRRYWKCFTGRVRTMGACTLNLLPLPCARYIFHSTSLTKPQVQRQNKELPCRNSKFEAFWEQCSCD